MKAVFLGIILGSMLTAAPPLQVAGVLRAGMPPYDESERLYRLEGEGCPTLGVSEYLTLQRSGERRNLGRLQVTAIKEGYALARLAVPGETYPLKGDLAVRHERVIALPALPKQTIEESSFPAEALAPRLPKLAIPLSPSKEALHREPIFFYKGSAELSPAALLKLQSWVAAWGIPGRWVLLVPVVPELLPAVSQARTEALQGALKHLGVKDVELRPMPPGPSAKYDSISVSKESW